MAREGTLTELHCLVCRVEGRVCALPLQHVLEVMRPAAVEPVNAVPAFVLGLAVIRGESVPVVDASLLLTGRRSPVTRFVSLRVEQRRVVLAVSAVIGTRRISSEVLADIPPLISPGSEFRRVLGVLDGCLLEVLECARIIDASAATVLSEATA